MADDHQFAFASGNLSDVESICSVKDADELFSKGKILPLEQPAKNDSVSQIHDKLLKQKQYLLDNLSRGLKGSPNHGLRTGRTPKSSKYTFRGEFYGVNRAAAEYKTPKTPAGKEHKTPRMPGTPSKASNSPERGYQETKKGYQDPKYTPNSVPPNPAHTKENEENPAPTFAHDPSKCRGSSMRKSFLGFLPFGSRNSSSSPVLRLHRSSSSKHNNFARSFSFGSAASSKKTNLHEVAVRRRSYLPYKQNLLGWLGCVIDVYDGYEPSANVPIW